MNKSELTVQMAQKSGLTQKAAGEALDAFIKTVSDAMAKGDKVQLIGFGTFEVLQKSAREARNPLTGETISVPACKAPKFKAGAALKKSIQ